MMYVSGVTKTLNTTIGIKLMESIALWIGYIFLVAAGFLGSGCAVYLAANFFWHQLDAAGKLAALMVWRKDELAKQKQYDKNKGCE